MNMIQKMVVHNSIVLVLAAFGIVALHNASVAEFNDRSQVAEYQIAQERKQIDAERVKAVKEWFAKESRGCSTKARLSNDVIAIGASQHGPYFSDTVYHMTFDEAWKAGKAGQAWILAWC